MQITGAQEFVALLEQSNLLTADQLCQAREFSETSDNPRSVAKQIVQQGWLTRWQAQQLLAGRHRLFLGKYRLLENIGQGGMGAVFKAEHSGLARIVALKVMAQELLQDPDAVSRFVREIQSAAALNHPNVVAAYDADCVDNTYFLVMEYVEGDDLRAWIRQHQLLPAPWSCECIRQAALGLQHAHENGLVHRDIKPANLLVVGNGGRQLPHVKILDMGLARFVSDAQEEGGLTRTGQIMGTPDYIAPEQGEDTHGADIRADIFSLGCTLFHAVTGSLPFSGKNVMEKLLARVRHDALRLSTLRPDIPAGLDDVVAKMLARDAADRYQTPAEVVLALTPYALGTMPAVTEPTILLQPKRDKSSRKVEAKADTPATITTAQSMGQRGWNKSPRVSRFPVRPRNGGGWVDRNPGRCRAGECGSSRATRRPPTCTAAMNYQELHASMGALAVFQGNYDAAIEYLERAIELDDSMATAHSNLALAYASADRFDEADEQLQKAVDRGYRQPDVIKG